MREVKVEVIVRGVAVVTVDVDDDEFADWACGDTAVILADFIEAGPEFEEVQKSVSDGDYTLIELSVEQTLRVREPDEVQ